MTIYNRPDEKVFASGARPGEVVAFPDIERGWGLAFEQTEGKPPMEWMNGLFQVMSEAVRYFMQRGLSEWSATEDYPAGAFVQHGGKAYRALQENSNVTPGTAVATWAEMTPNASTSIRGLIEIATEAEAKALVDALRSITPSTLGAVLEEFGTDLPKVRTFTEIVAQTEDIGPVIVIGMDGIWEWVQTAHFTGYRHPYCGMWMDGWTPTPLPFQIAATGGTWRESDEKERRVIARYRESGLVVPSAEWIKGQNMIADLGGGNWKAPDLQDMFKRMTGTDVDTANARVLGSHQMDALQNITGSISQWKTDHGIFETADGVFAPGPVVSSGDVPGVTGGTAPAMFRSFSFDASRVVRTAAETRSLSSATSPFIHV